MKDRLRTLFPHLYPIMSEWEAERWMVFPIVLVWLIAPLSAIVHSIMISLGWISDPIP